MDTLKKIGFYIAVPIVVFFGYFTGLLFWLFRIDPDSHRKESVYVSVGIAVWMIVFVGWLVVK